MQIISILVMLVCVTGKGLKQTKYSTDLPKASPYVKPLINNPEDTQDFLIFIVILMTFLIVIHLYNNFTKRKKPIKKKTHYHSPNLRKSFDIEEMMCNPNTILGNLVLTKRRT